MARVSEVENGAIAVTMRAWLRSRELRPSPAFVCLHHTQFHRSARAECCATLGGICRVSGLPDTSTESLVLGRVALEEVPMELSGLVFSEYKRGISRIALSAVQRTDALLAPAFSATPRDWRVELTG